ncbi:MAG TPA: hypothetical protein QF458_03130 [Candidatus Woesearchaeota archaeon]|nr:hypothetical protein [Candidatus Woesearchaeota archaeon]
MTTPMEIMITINDDHHHDDHHDDHHHQSWSKMKKNLHPAQKMITSP